jgi:hypothetical protein
MWKRVITFTLLSLYPREKTHKGIQEASWPSEPATQEGICSPAEGWICNMQPVTSLSIDFPVVYIAIPFVHSFISDSIALCWALSSFSVFLGVKGRPSLKADNLAASSGADCLENVGTSTSHNPMALHVFTIFLLFIHSRWDSLDRGSARRKAVTYTQTKRRQKHPCLEPD